MYTSIGKKLKGLAIIVCSLGMLAAGIFGAFTAFTSSLFAGLLYFGLGCLLSWIGSWFIYAFGQATEDAETARVQVNELYRDNAAKAAEAAAVAAAAAAEVIPAGKKVCPHCGALNNRGNAACFACEQSIG